MRRPRRHLRRMGDDQHLRLPRKPRQPLADRARDRPADAAVDLVEDHRPRASRLGQRDLQRQHEARQLAAAGDLGQRSERRAGIGRDFELDPVRARGTRLRRRDRRTEPRGVQLQRVQARPRPRRRAVAAASCRSPLSAVAQAPNSEAARLLQFAVELARSARRRPRSRTIGVRIRSASSASASGSTRCLRASPRMSNSRASAASSRAGSKARASAARTILSSASLASITARSSAASASASKRMVGRSALDPPRRQPKLGQRAVRTHQAVRRGRSGFRPPSAPPAWPLARRPAASLRQLPEQARRSPTARMRQIVAVAFGRRQLRARLEQLSLRSE